MIRLLAEVCDITMGQAPVGTSYNDRGEGLPLIAGAGDFDGDRLVPKKYTTRPTKVAQSGDIVLSIRASIGAKVWSNGTYCLGRGVAGLRPGPDVDPAFLWHWLTQVEHLLVAKGRGATFLQVNRDDIAEMRIDLPPRHEQRRLADLLDRADDLRAGGARVASCYEALVQARYREMFESDDVPRKPLREVAQFVRGVTFKPEDKVAPGSGAVAVMRTKNVQRELDRSDEIYIPASLVKRSEQYLEVGDTLISSANSWNLVGKACLVRHLHAPAVVGGFLTALRSGGDLHPVQLYSWFSSPRVQAIVRSFSNQTTNIANLDLKRCAELEVPVPALDLQHDFVAFVKQVQSQRQTVRQALVAADELFASLQHRAFRGEL